VKIIYVYLITLVLFLAIDSIWLGLLARSFYQSQIGALLLDRPRFGVAGAFYLLYAVGLLYFAILPGLNAGSLVETSVRAALFGFFCYLTYDLSNLATLKGYGPGVAVADIAWGSVLNLIVGATTFAIVRSLSS